MNIYVVNESGRAVHVTVVEDPPRTLRFIISDGSVAVPNGDLQMKDVVAHDEHLEAANVPDDYKFRLRVELEGVKLMMGTGIIPATGAKVVRFRLIPASKEQTT